MALVTDYGEPQFMNARGCLATPCVGLRGLGGLSCIRLSVGASLAGRESHFLKHKRLRAIALELRHGGSWRGNVGDRPQYGPPVRPKTMASHWCTADFHSRWGRDT